MKKVQACVVENCIPTPSSCVEWNGGDLEYLGICNGDSLNNIVWEIVTKLKEIAGEDISNYDVSELLSICNQKAPLEVTLISILDLIKANQVCLKEYTDSLYEQLQELFKEQGIEVNLKCYANFDNLGNPASLTRAQLDQLIINELCNHEGRLDSIEGDIVLIKQDILNLSSNTTVDELNFSTCVDAVIKPTSSQVVSVANAHCALETATGDPTDIASALSKVGADWNTEFGVTLSGLGYVLSPANMADVFGNALLIIENLRSRLAFIEDNCCAATCDDIKLGFSAVFNEDYDGIILKFTSGAGTSIPAGFTDLGSTGVVKDIDGNVETFSLTISNGYEVEIPVSGLNLNSDLEVDITAKIGTDGLVCEKCIHKTVKSSSCGYCEITATGDDGSQAVVIYEDGQTTTSVPVYPTEPTTSTTTTTTAATTTSTTTTTTAP